MQNFLPPCFLSALQKRMPESQSPLFLQGAHSPPMGTGAGTGSADEPFANAESRQISEAAMSSFRMAATLCADRRSSKSPPAPLAVDAEAVHDGSRRLACAWGRHGDRRLP